MEHFPLVDRLHTDVLEKKYGPIHADIIEHTQRYRRAHLKDDNNISRTFAITIFPEEGLDSSLENINEEIRSGEAIGKTFREHGYNIRKNVIDVYTVKLPAWLQQEFDTSEHFAKARLSEFLAKQEGQKPLSYGVVVEIYSPDFRPPAINEVDIAQLTPTVSALQHIGIDAETVWEHIGEGTTWKQPEFEQARNESLEFIYTQKAQIESLLQD